TRSFARSATAASAREGNFVFPFFNLREVKSGNFFEVLQRVKLTFMRPILDDGGSLARREVRDILNVLLRRTIHVHAAERSPQVLNSLLDVGVPHLCAQARHFVHDVLPPSASSAVFGDGPQAVTLGA